MPVLRIVVDRRKRRPSDAAFFRENSITSDRTRRADRKHLPCMSHRRVKCQANCRHRSIRIASRSATSAPMAAFAGRRIGSTSIVCAGEYVDLEEIDDEIWNVYFGPLKLGRLHERHMRIESEYGRLNADRKLSMLPDFFVAYLPDRSHSTLTTCFSKSVFIITARDRTCVAVRGSAINS